MYYNTLLIVLILILLFVFYRYIFRAKKKTVIVVDTGKNAEIPVQQVPKPGLTTGADTLPDEDGQSEDNTTNIHFDKYKDVPRNSGCSDEFSNCASWAANGECEANPDFMIQNCPNSCKSCNLTQEQKSDLVRYYMNEPLKKCIYRGEPYPPGIRLNMAISDMYR